MTLAKSTTRLALAAIVGLIADATARADDPFRVAQAEAIATRDEARPRPFHFGAQGPGGVFSKSTGHSNRLVPVYVFGKKADLGAVTGENSVYRNAEKLKALYGAETKNTVDPGATYCDQSDLFRVQREAVEKGAKRLFVVWFDGLDWETTRAAALAKTGRDYREGKGSGLNFLDLKADGTAQFGACVTSPRHDQSERNVDTQTVEVDLTKSLPGGYDPRFGGLVPWEPGPLLSQGPGYLNGASATAEERRAVINAGGIVHAVTDSAPSAGEFATGQKSFNDGINVGEDGRFVPTLFNTLQGEHGWKVGTVTSVPFSHASPAAIYAHNVDRDDYQDLSREMLGLRSIAQELGKDPQLPGLDVVIGMGRGVVANARALERLGKNGVPGPLFLTEADREAIDVENDGPYVVAETTPGVDGGRALRAAAARAALGGKKLFGYYGREGLDHLPYRTADGRFDPAPGQRKAEEYTAADLHEQPTLADMTEAAIDVLAADPDKPFALFVEAGDVDFALHDNNLDNAVGAVHSGCDAIDVIVDWVAAHGGWDDSVLIVTADHGHYLVIDDPAALVPAKR